MTLRLPDATLHARIVKTLSGPITCVQLRHVPSDWVIFSMQSGPRVEETADRIRRSAVRKGYVVDDGIAVEDWNAIVEEMKGTWRRARKG